MIFQRSELVAICHHLSLKSEADLQFNISFLCKSLFFLLCGEGFFYLAMSRWAVMILES